jgi:CBS domain-containing protein
MMEKKTVGEIVKGRPLYVAQENDSVLEAVHYMTKYRVGALPVLAEGHLVGILSERDVMTRVVAQELNPASVKISQVMTRKVALLEKDKDYCQALATMNQLHIRHLPITDGRHLVGCVSIRELLEIDVECKDAEIQFLDDYIRKVESVM